MITDNAAKSVSVLLNWRIRSKWHSKVVNDYVGLCQKNFFALKTNKTEETSTCLKNVSKNYYWFDNFLSEEQSIKKIFICFIIYYNKEHYLFFTDNSGTKKCWKMSAKKPQYKLTPLRNSARCSKPFVSPFAAPNTHPKENKKQNTAGQRYKNIIHKSYQSYLVLF